jgi:hypothetical protein
MTDPVFVLSAPRSGSTLLRVMLAGHPRLFCPPELNLLNFDTMRAREAALGPCQAAVCAKRGCDQRHGLQRALMKLHSIDDVASQGVIDGLVGADVTIPDVYELLIQLAAPRRLVDKSPSYASRDDILVRSTRLFRRPQFLYLHRHPYPVIASLLQNGFERSTHAAESVWTSANQRIQSFLSTVDASQKRRLAYESLVSDPEGVLHDICHFLGIEFHAAVLTPYADGRMTDGIRPGIACPGDPNFHSHTSIDASLGSARPAVRLTESMTRHVGARLLYDLR